ncbi:Lecithin:cholesterol acyltransferase-domain-containing protein [Russula earlei]|uniref:Lecithin:cholesterol acyltransferase-domain-containing protein n=1 Tax=Russula earlei TaxID=71964 RepID=A0ACC0U5E1_9AGAM|nr:Lecithin:cholesterol acyltransferase-domain-containing protein [Russula earlei]
MIPESSTTEQSETDTQSQISEEPSSESRTGPGKRKTRRFYSRPRLLFPLGIILGIVLGVIFIEPSNLADIPGLFAVFLEEYDISLSLPQIDLSRVQAEWRKLISTIPEPWKLNTDGREFQIGDAIKARGLEANHPVILIPGVISTSLESWSTSPEYRAFFRQKVWGGFPMLSQVTFNREKWMSMLLLDPVTGLDPDGVKVRASGGFDAASSFIQGYWIWSKVIENLAVVNYDTNNLVLAPYDWRLSMYNLEERDGYFSRLKTAIEGFRMRQRKKCVIAAHSMGSTVLLLSFPRARILVPCHSLKWVESPAHGKGGPNWVESHIQAIVSIAGTHLGVTKAMAALLSGEMKDTVDLNPAGAYVLERFFSKKERQSLFRSWAGGASMWIKGGNAVWGDATFAPDDEEGGNHTHGELVSFRQTIDLDDMDVETPPVMQGPTQTAAAQGQNKMPSVMKNMTSDEAGTWILGHTPLTFRVNPPSLSFHLDTDTLQRMIATNYSYGIERDEEALKRNDLDHTKWTNPLEIRLPNAPSLRLYCVYGHGKETERSYWYTTEPYEDEDKAVELGVCTKDNICPGWDRHSLHDMTFSRSWIDRDLTNEGSIPKVRNGVKLGEGDGTVSLLSLGAMCVEGWKRKRWNPAGIKIITVELPHQPQTTLPRGGANTSDHVDILGSNALNEIILKVATGAGDEIHDNYVSRIRQYAKRIRWEG